MSTDIVDQLRATRFKFHYRGRSNQMKKAPTPVFPTKRELDAADEIDRLRRDLASKQAEIDALMLEHCPGEMTPEQRAEWGRHQQTYRISEAEQAAVKRALMRSFKVIDPPPVEITPQQAVQNMEDAGLSWFQKPPDVEWDGRCLKCHSAMQPGKAMAWTLTGVPGFPGSEIRTLSAGGPGRLIDCLKCSACGWSVTIPEPEAAASGSPINARSD